MNADNTGGVSEDLLDDDFLFYSHIYCAITVVFAMGVLSKFLTNDFRFGFRSFLTLGVLFCGEPICHLLLRGPSGVILFGLGCIFIYKILPSRHLPVAGKSVLITGCDSGFGHALAQKLDSIGVMVYAGCLTSDGPGAKQLKASCSERLQILQLNVTDGKQINDAFDMLSLKLKDEGLWGLVNNAGMAVISELELTSEEMFRKCLEINLYGVVRVTKAFLPLIRHAQGRVVNMSSATGRVPMECFGAYAVSKAGVEAYSDVLRMEMRKWNVKVCVIQPGGFGTSAMANERVIALRDQVWSSLDEATQSTYGRDYFECIHRNFLSSVSQYPVDLSPVVSTIRSALFSVDPSERYPVGRGVGTFVALFSVLPVCIADRIAWLINPTVVKDARPATLLATNANASS